MSRRKLEIWALLHFLIAVVALVVFGAVAAQPVCRPALAGLIATIASVVCATAIYELGRLDGSKQRPSRAATRDGKRNTKIQGKHHVSH